MSETDARPALLGAVVRLVAGTERLVAGTVIVLARDGRAAAREMLAGWNVSVRVTAIDQNPLT
jgi:hypothetical protein